MSHIDIVGVPALQQAIANPGIISIVDFWAEWCGPCRMLGPILEQVAEKFPEKIQIVKVNVDDPANSPLAMQYRISNIPRVIFFIGGNLSYFFTISAACLSTSSPAPFNNIIPISLLKSFIFFKK